MASLARFRARVGALLSASAFCVAGCGEESISTLSHDNSSTSLSIRQTDDHGTRLPFDTRHPNRWSRANNGSTYEPCTALGANDLRLQGLDPATVEDAAGTDGQTLRGCVWASFRELDGLPDWSISQFVGNSGGLQEYKRRYSSLRDIWAPDKSVAGRTIGVHRSEVPNSCDTYVQSGRAGVHTVVSHHGLNRPDPAEICAKAIEFTRATIAKMPL